MYTKTSRTLALCAFTLLLVGIGIATTMPAAGQYEISLYSAYPAVFWVAIIGAQFAGCLAILGSVRTSGDRAWMFGLSAVLLSNLLLLLLPYLRGYEMYGRTDSMTHVGFILDIVNTGVVEDNIYPPTHLLSMVVADATSAEVTTIVLLLPVVFWSVYFVSMSYLLISLFDERSQILFGLPFVILPVHASLGLRPFDVGVALVPLTLYLFIKSQRHATPPVRAVFVVTLAAFILYHPLTALFAIGIMAVYLLGRYAPQITDRYATPTNFFSLAAAVMIAWYSNFVGVILRFNRVYNRVFGVSDGSAPIGAYTETINETSPALVDILAVITFQYGIELVLFGLGFVFVGVALWLSYRREYALDTYTLMFIGTLAVFSFGGLAFLLIDLEVTHDRPFKIAKIGGAILTGQLFYLVWRHTDWSISRPAGTGYGLSLIVVLLLVVSLATFSLFPAPQSSTKNQQVTEMEVEGTEWLTVYGDSSQELMQFDILYFRFYDAQYGRNTTKPFNGVSPPPRFNYTESEYLGDNFQNERYLTITRLGREFYPTVHPDYRANWRYTPENFERLEKDTTVDRVYDSGDYDQYLVRTGENTTVASGGV
ncbi:hypothetical protein [Salinigranum marinum]|uniref:hypothetical protein n=1 Tax=Salinigranum marinum TaxID=1515595 RepID=UPI002989DC14|nr:hypothetical protein [Salinigranum marinum]